VTSIEFIMFLDCLFVQPAFLFHNPILLWLIRGVFFPSFSLMLICYGELSTGPLSNYVDRLGIIYHFVLKFG
jgi:hypothetical protein